MTRYGVGQAALQSPLLFIFVCFLHVVWATGWGQPCPYDALTLRESGSVIGADFWGSGVVVLTVLGSNKARSHGHCACVPVSPLRPSSVLWMKQLGHQAFPSRFSVSRSPCLSPDGAWLPEPCRTLFFCGSCCGGRGCPWLCFYQVAETRDSGLYPVPLVLPNRGAFAQLPLLSRL